MKNVLVIDAPDKCVNCPLSYYGIDGLNCKPLRKMIEDDKPNWCPLRPMPEQMSWGHTADYINGYNACLEEITGEAK